MHLDKYVYASRKCEIVDPVSEANRHKKEERPYCSAKESLSARPFFPLGVSERCGGCCKWRGPRRRCRWIYYCDDEVSGPTLRAVLTKLVDRAALPSGSYVCRGGGVNNSHTLPQPGSRDLPAVSSPRQKAGGNQGHVATKKYDTQKLCMGLCREKPPK